MLSRMLSTVALFCTVIILSSCIVTSHLEKDDISCQQFDLNNHITKEFNIKVGDKITLALCSNPSTGFKWGYEIIEENVIKEEDHDFEAGINGDVGVAGKEIWTFEAVNSGSTSLKMDYSQTGEGGIKEQWTYTMNIAVD